MKKLFISLGVALGLLASTTTQAQTTEPFLLPAYVYSVESTTGTFTDISNDPSTVKLGEDLAAGTDLKNRVFLGTQIEGRTNVSKVNANNNTATLTDTCFPLGFKFKISGRPMTHFVVSAFGGAYFSDTMVRGANSSMPLTGPASKNCFWAYPYVKSSATATSCSMPGAGKVVTKEGQAPAMYLISGTENNHVLTIQYDYLVQGDEWVFQFKFYESTGNAEFIVKDLPFANALASEKSPAFHKILLGFTEDGQPATATDPFGSNFLNITPLIASTQHKFTIGQSDAASAAKGWDTLAIGTSATQPGQMRIDADHHPEDGRTIRFVYPNACPEHATKYTAEHYNITDQSMAEDNSFSANIHFQKAMFQSAESIVNSGSIVAIISEDETPQYTLANGTWYKKGDTLNRPLAEGEFAETVLCNAQPKVTLSPRYEYGYNMGKAIALSAPKLKKAMQYYVHIYNMKYDCDGAPVYSELCHTLPVTTNFDMPKQLKAGLATVNSVDITAEPAEGYAVLLLKSKTQNCKPSGVLKKGDKIGEEAEVIDLLTQKTTTPLTLAENEGAYILAYTVNTADPEHYVYAPNALSVSVRAAYPTLPGVIDFADAAYIPADIYNPQWQHIAATTLRPLPYGWTRETPIATETDRGKAFGTGKPNYDRNIRTYLYAEAKSGVEFDFVTPVFVCDKERVIATFNMTQLSTVDETATAMGKPANADSIVIEYAIEDGEWQSGINFTGAELPETNEEGYYPLECKIHDKDIRGKRMRLRYRYFGTVENTFQGLPSIEIKEDRLCDKPHSIHQLDSLTTDRSATICWTDENYPAATGFKIYYKPDGNETAEWKNVSSNVANVTIKKLEVNTSYKVYVTATCGTDGDSYDSYTSAFSTILNFPHTETMKQDPNHTVIIGGTPVSVKGDGPFQRGWTTATGKWINSADGETKNATLTVTNPSLGDNFAADDSYAALANHDIPTSVAVRENKADTNAWLLSPMLYIEKYEKDFPLTLSFKANSAYQKLDTTVSNVRDTTIDGTATKIGDTVISKSWVKGQIPELYTGAKLYVLVSNNGHFSLSDTIASIPISGKNIEDQAFTFDIDGFEGQAQIAFNFLNPKASDADEAPLMLFELFDVTFDYAGSPCFPLTDLERSNTTTEGATFAWRGNAVEYIISWDLNSAEGYAHSATVTEPTYTITGLNEYTRYKVKVVGYCDEQHTQISPNELTASFMTLRACHTPLNFEVADITVTGATFISKTDQEGYTSQRIVYVSPKADAETELTFVQIEDTLTVADRFTKTTTYMARTAAVCGTDTSAMSQAVEFTTLTPPSFTLTLNVTPENAGTVTGANRYEEGEQVTITATAAEAFDFVAWMDDDTELSKDMTYTFTMPAEDVTYTAVFKEKTVTTDEYLLTLNITPENAGTVTGAGRYEEGANVTISATAAEGYDFVAWMDEDNELSKEASYSFTMPAENVTYTAKFVKQVGNEDILDAAFNVMTQNGQLLIRNLKGLTVEEVAVYNLTGKLINRFPLNSREDLVLPIDAQNALLLVRIATEQGVTVYKVYLH